ncbi:hypothetical protein [Alkalispirochaeta americana]|uniref:hypothetical protein n=1 Tax=Alkalispirochaeta americana TaxID=159291 RepID=UPI00135644EE
MQLAPGRWTTSARGTYRYIAESRRNLNNRLIPYFGRKKLSIVRPEDIMRWKYELYKNGDPGRR